MTPIENAIAQLGGQAAAAQLFGLAGYQAVQSWWRNNRVPAEYCPRIESLTGVRCEDLNDRVEWSLIRGTAPAATTDHTAQLRAAIQQTREVFKSELAASDAVRYLEALLDSNAFFASAAVPAQTGKPAGGAAASIAEEANTAAGAAPVAGTDKLQRDLDAVLAVLERQMQSSRRIGESFTDLARRYDQQAAHVESLTAALAGALAQPTAADQAAAAMAAESAQLVADAERSVAARGAPLTLQQVGKVEDSMLALLAEPLTNTQRAGARIAMVAEFRALNAMGVQPAASPLEF